MFPRLLEIGSFHVASYGLFVALGYLAGILLLKRYREEMGLSEDRFWTLIYAVFFGAVLGGKLMFIALNWGQFSSGQLHLIRDFRYGFVFYGGFIGCLASGAWYARRLGVPFFANADYFALAGAVGHAIGRLGCLAAGCCHGAPTTLPWAITFRDPDCLVPDSLLGRPLHPSQLYEVLGNLLIAGAVWKLLAKRAEGRVAAGTPFLVYIPLYALLRFLVEFTRADDRGGFLLGLSPAQWTAVLLVAAALAAWVLRRRPRLAGA
ncbi:MAG: prolipoprotein diacylglyceryl transferase [Elusimicrobia bacterium]|nr:prolipoprotein diacylglyceryl transferase [Elusimicrobiota bacterium]